MCDSKEKKWRNFEFRINRLKRDYKGGARNLNEYWDAMTHIVRSVCNYAKLWQHSCFSEMSTNRVFFCNKMSTNWAFICNKISSKYLCRFVDSDELRCLRIGTNAVSIRRHRRIRLSTNRDKCGVDSSTSTNRDVYQFGYLRIDLLPVLQRLLNYWSE